MLTRVVGIDPGYDRLGIAVVERKDGKDMILESCCITTSKNDEPHIRLKMIADAFKHILETHSPEVAGIESLFFNTNQRTAIRVAEARGVLLLEAARFSIPVFEYTPGQIKLAITGHGKSDKGQVMNMVNRLVTISKPITYDDEYDAIAVALTCLAYESRSFTA